MIGQQHLAVAGAGGAGAQGVAERFRADLGVFPGATALWAFLFCVAHSAAMLMQDAIQTRRTAPGRQPRGRDDAVYNTPTKASRL